MCHQPRDSASPCSLVVCLCWALGLSESQKSDPETWMQGIPLNFGKRMVVRSIISILSALLATDAAMSLTEELANKFGPLRWNGDEQTW